MGEFHTCIVETSKLDHRLDKFALLTNQLNVIAKFSQIAKNISKSLLSECIADINERNKSYLIKRPTFVLYQNCQKCLARAVLFITQNISMLTIGLRASQQINIMLATRKSYNRLILW